MLRRLLRERGVPSAQEWVLGDHADREPPWDLAVGADLAIRRVKGRRSLPTRLQGRYIRRLHAAAAHDPTLTARFVRVASLLDPPRRLLRPATVTRVLQARLRARGRHVAPFLPGAR